MGFAFSPVSLSGGGGKGPYNWLTQSSMDTFADYSQSLTTDTQSSLLFTVGKSSTSKPGARRTGAPVGPGFGKDRLGGAGKDQTDGREGMWKTFFGRVDEILIKRNTLLGSDYWWVI